MTYLFILLVPFLSNLKKPNDVFLDNSNSAIYFLYDNKIESYDLNNNFHLKQSKNIKNFSAFDLAKFKFVNKTKLTSNYGGDVLSIKGDSIVEIDNSYEHRMQFNSIEFIRSDTIFRYGGYGFFECRNFFTYYDNNTNEWESLDIEGNVIPERLIDFVYFINKEKLFISGGYKFDQFKKDLRTENLDTYVFDFKSRKWSILGKMKIHLIRKNAFIINDEVLVFQEDLIHKLNFESNEIHTYFNNSISKKIGSSVLNPLFFNGNILFFHFQNGKIEIFTIPLNAFISDLKIKNSGQVYYNYLEYVVIFLSVIALLIFVFLMNKFVRLFYKKLRKVNENYFFNFRKIPLSDSEKLILDTLYFSSKNFKRVDNRVVTDFFDDKSLNYGTINKRKNETIQHLNNKLMLVFKMSENIILKEYSKIDKREVLYYLNSKIL
jgi:hypothetical protein